MMLHLDAIKPVIDKPWGYERVLFEGPDYMVKELTLLHGRTSLHYHEYRHETLLAVESNGSVDVDGQSITFADQSVVDIPVGVRHRIWGPAHVLEVATLYPDDVIRIEDDYGRVE